jgi:hypothetical protein
MLVLRHRMFSYCRDVDLKHVSRFWPVKFRHNDSTAASVIANTQFAELTFQQSAKSTPYSSQEHRNQKRSCKKYKLNSVALVRKRNITDRATAACRRSLCLRLRVEGVAWSAQRIPTAVNLGFRDRSRYFFIHVAPQCPHEAEWTPSSENLVGPGIEPGTCGSVARNSDH